MDFCDGMFGDSFSEGRWNGKAIPIMNELGQMPSPVSPILEIKGESAEGR